MQQAEWNDITWGTSGKSFANISSLTLSQSLKTEEQTEKNGQDKISIKGLESEELTVVYKAGFSVGLDPRGEMDMLKKCVGMQDDFLLAGVPISSTQFELDEISLSNTTLSDTGRILAGEITLNFNTEKDPSTKGGKGTKKKKKTGSKKTKKKSSLTIKPEDVAKAKAMSNQ